ncbi:MAG: beta-N-acetylglucosaminidase [Rhodothermaeota bacterium MED-G16]|nr:MAG: beta-N-acetylglucosaminidase [Rhodothermaeota bacterium MED-G16]
MIKYIYVIILTLFCFNLKAQRNFILPEPQNISFPQSKQTGFRLSKKTSIEVSGVNTFEPFVKSFVSFVKAETGFELKTKVNKKSNIYLQVENGIINLGDEGYKISILPKENLIVQANTIKGLFYGLESLKQIIHFTKRKREEDNFNEFDTEVLVTTFKETSNNQNFNAANLTTSGYKSVNETGYYQGLEEVETKSLDVYNITPMIVEDFPRFNYRGMMLDVSRHFMPKDFIKKFIDIIAMHKMNKFHWHLTDDQGWRIEIKNYPKLTEVGSIREKTIIGHARFAGKNPRYDNIIHKGYYSQDEIKEIVQYASERFIEIIPEIDMPGHTASLIASYPELGTSEEEVKVKTTWGVQDEILKPTENTFNFLDNLFREVAELFPSNYIHIGGDEARKKQWEESEEVQKIMENLEIEEEDSLQTYFVSRVKNILRKYNKKLIGWDEIIEGGLIADATVMSWRGEEGGIIAAQSGNDAIMTPTSHLYFDYYQAKTGEPLAIGGLITLDKVYSYEPIPEGLDINEATKILGAQANVWTEYIKKPEMVEYMSVPRMTALSEIVWSKRKVRDIDEFRKRLNFFRYFLDKKDINYRENDFKK